MNFPGYHGGHPGDRNANMATLSEFTDPGKKRRWVHHPAGALFIPHGHDYYLYGWNDWNPYIVTRVVPDIDMELIDSKTCNRIAVLWEDFYHETPIYMDWDEFKTIHYRRREARAQTPYNGAAAPTLIA